MLYRRSIKLLVFLASALCATAQQAEFVSAVPPTPSSHASTVVELANGDLLAAWFGGTREGAPDVGIWLSRRGKGGWDAPVEVVREPAIAAYNPVLFEAGQTLWLYYKFGPNPQSWSAGRRQSRDGGRTWTAPQHLPAGVYGPIRAKPLVMTDRTIVSGTSVESYGTWACWIERSTDGGSTWSRFGPIAGPPPAEPNAAAPRPPGEPTGIIQPSIVSLGGQRLRLFARSTKDIGRIVTAESGDGGRTWTAATVTTLPNPNSGIDVVRLADGRFVMVYNHTTSGRSPLNLAVSRDGAEWRMFRVLESDPGEFSYPALIQGRNGDLHLTYTWNRKKISYLRIPLRDVPATSH